MLYYSVLVCTNALYILKTERYWGEYLFLGNTMSPKTMPKVYKNKLYTKSSSNKKNTIILLDKRQTY